MYRTLTVRHRFYFGHMRRLSQRAGFSGMSTVRMPFGIFFPCFMKKKKSTVISTVLLEYLGLYTVFQHPQMFQQSHIHHVDVVIIEANGYKN